MDDIDPVVKNIQGYAVENKLVFFEKTIPQQSWRLSQQLKRIHYKTYAGTTKIIELKKQSKYSRIIFNACAFGLQSDWFSRLGDRSKHRYHDNIRRFFDWINESGYKAEGTNRYNVLKDYEAYLMNDKELKHSTLSLINTILREGLACTSLTSEDHDYIRTLTSLSKPSKSTEQQSVTLSRWLDLPWLRAILGEEAYLQLESPRLLFNSFRVTIATSLLWLLEQRGRWEKSCPIDFAPSYKCWYYDWNRLLLKHIGEFNSQDEAEDEFSQLLLIDLIVPNAQSVVKNRLDKYGSQDLPKSITYGKNKNPPWQRPVFFHPSYQTQYSPVEELLCAWLVACEAVQPSDIPKLKTSNYACERNRFGRLIAMECTYYKGRAGTTKQPAILMGSDPWTKAMDNYMTGLSMPSLFRTKIAEQNKFPALDHTHNAMSLLVKVWKLPSFQRTLNTKLELADATSVFSRAMLALELGNENYTQFYKRTRKSVNEYYNLTPKPLPASCFTLTHIKTTAVHARSDTYRESDLINHHSHTSLTEKISYLTDANKEWVNQAHRITRLVLHDLQNVVFQPSITEISQSVKDLELRTRIIEATHMNEVVTHSLRYSSIEDSNGSKIIVSDTIDTALYFIHYITQAEENLSKLLSVRPDWVERTLIVKLEWMTRTLMRMKTAAAAQKAYIKLSAHLPPLFSHVMETTE
ncbi:hypothetical protein [Halomonas sp. MMSF_3323]|uniref:hypothetical protein n=1 Tax=Halomonas sp. MMSF_3323 TaxID=3046701 RepID=UPI00273EDDC3|nr:hypothetical protein [Halomonas sp. MMSF_3323]